MGKYSLYKKGTYKYSLVWLAAALMTVALAASLWVNFQRLQVESRNRTLGLLADYDELQRISDSVPDVEFADILGKAQRMGITGLVVRERLLSDWEAAGKVTVMQGGQLQLILDLRKDLTQTEAISQQKIVPQAQRTYILTKEHDVFNQLFSLLEAKKRYPVAFEMGDYLGIEVQLYSGEKSTLGLGYPMEELQLAADLGLEVIPRVRSWAPVSGENLAEEFNWVSQIPGLAAVGFNDASVPGGDSPHVLDKLAEAVGPLDVPLVSFEFYDQAGLAALAGRLDQKLIRGHAIAENELKKYTDNEEALDRFSLAAAERNIRYIYLRYSNMDNPAAAMEPNMEYTKYIRESLEAEGFLFGSPVILSMPGISYPAKFFIGLGVIACGGWLVGFAFQPVAGSKFNLPLVLFLAVGIMVWGVLLMKQAVLAVKLAALAAAVCFPSLSAVIVLKGLDRTEKGKGSLLQAILSLVLMSLGTFAGAMIMSALLADTAFMLKLNSFAGVKVAHLIPLLIVPPILWLREKDWQRLLRGTAGGNVKFWHLGVGVFILAALAVYILRTGNDSVAAVSGLELKFRQMLTAVMGVRPRTKEFLIGHPLMLILLYFGYSFKMYPVLLMGLIGQISLINTYAHIHTPLAVSFLRSANGLWLGIILGIIGILVIKLLLKWFKPVLESGGSQAIGRPQYGRRKERI